MLVKFTERTSDMILNVTQNIRLILYPIKTPITMRPTTVFYNYFQEKMKTAMIDLVITNNSNTNKNNSNNNNIKTITLPNNTRHSVQISKDVF